MSIHNIDQLFNTSSSDQQVKVPDQLWDRVDRQLNRQKSSQLSFIQRMGPWMAIAALGTILLMAIDHTLVKTPDTARNTYKIVDLEFNSPVKFTAETIIHISQYNYSNSARYDQSSSSPESLNG